MNIIEISKMPTNESKKNLNFKYIEIHENIFRAYHILEKVKDYLEDDVPGKVILELIETMEA